MKPEKMKTLSRSLVFFLLPLFFFAWTSINSLSGFTLHLALLLGLVAISLSFAKKMLPASALMDFARSVLHISFAVTLVGATGWFFSPFFFLLYLAPLYLGFLFNPTVSFSFLAGLLLIFSSSIGEVDVAYDILTLISLLLVIPLVIYLRRTYLILRQSHRDILILNDESGIKDADTIAKLLSNKITSLGVNMRQPLTFIKQGITVLMESDLEEKEALKYLQRIRTTAIETLDMIRAFERETSNNVVLENTPDKTINKPK